MTSNQVTVGEEMVTITNDKSPTPKHQLVLGTPIS